MQEIRRPRGRRPTLSLVASRALVGVAARSLAGVDDITLPQFRALVVLTGGIPVTVGDLATTLDIHRSTLHGCVTDSNARVSSVGDLECRLIGVKLR